MAVAATDEPQPLSWLVQRAGCIVSYVAPPQLLLLRNKDWQSGAPNEAASGAPTKTSRSWFRPLARLSCCMSLRTTVVVWADFWAPPRLSEQIRSPDSSATARQVSH